MAQSIYLYPIEEYFNLGGAIFRSNSLDISKYPPINPEEEGMDLSYFMGERKGKFWSHQDY